MNNILKELIRECISEALDGNIGSDGNVDQHRNSVDNMQKGFAYMLDELDLLPDYNKLTDREKSSFVSGIKGYIDRYFSDRTDAPRN
jgi:hydrogenase maturation factor HypF (carbamoyltransferase family)